MLDFSHLASQYGNADVQTFLGDARAPVEGWKVWTKPRGKSMAHILLLGSGGNGGTGVTGAASTAAGGGGGGSGSQTSLTIPLWAVPDRLYMSLSGGGNIASYIAINPDTAATSANVLAIAGAGGNGGNASGATAGTAGTAGAVATAATMPLGWMWADQVLAGQAGIAGGTTGSGSALTLPTTGLLVTGGTGGAGVGNAASTGSAAGAITGSGIFPTLAGGAAAGSQTTPAGDGQSGYQPVLGLLRLYGGTGGGSTGGAATGGGLVKSFGGKGMPGCGGGGGGGGFTGSTGGGGGGGGPAFAVIVCW